MSSPVYEERQKNKRLRAQARKAAARLYPDSVPHFDDVKVMLDGAFVDVTVWVPLAEDHQGGCEVICPIDQSRCPNYRKCDDGCLYVKVKAPRRVYVAAPYEMRDEAIKIKRVLENLEYEVTSRWLTQLDEEGDAGARMDLADVERADALLLLNPEEFRRIGTGGRHCEFMYAWTLGKKIVVLGVRSNIFHHLSNVRVIDKLEDF